MPMISCTCGMTVTKYQYHWFTVVFDRKFVGAKSMAKGEIAPCTLVGGVPAKVLREQVSWSRVPGTLQFLEQELNGMSVAFDAGQPTASGCEQRSS